MNFSENQQTGVLAELDVKRLFMSWGWNVGRDQVDEGYDLLVAPDRTRFRGARFLVQVKGTSRRKGGRIAAQVSRRRLRQYAEDILPVFIVRVLADGSMYWLHAQLWAHGHAQALSGAGMAQVHFDNANNLADKTSFESYLMRVLPRVPGNITAFDEAVDEVGLLNALDPRLRVRVSGAESRPTRQISAVSEPVETTFRFTPEQPEEGVKALKDAIEFGLPCSIDVENFTVAGSPLFEHITEQNPGRGRLSINHGTGEAGVVRVYPGSQYSMTAERLLLEADLFRGRAGIAISNTSRESIFDLSLRLSFHHHEGLKVHLDLAVRASPRPASLIQNVDALRPLANWSEQVMRQGALYIEFEFSGKRETIPFPETQVVRLRNFLHWIRTLSRLHLVARSLNSELPYEPGRVFRPEEIGDIDLAYLLLKGDRRRVQLDRLEFDAHPTLAGGVVCSGKYLDTLTFTVNGHHLGDIPVTIELTDYVSESVAGSDRSRLVMTDDSEAWIAYDEHTHAENGNLYLN